MSNYLKCPNERDQPDIWNCLLKRALVAITDEKHCQRILSYISKYYHNYNAALVSLAIDKNRSDFLKHLLEHGHQKICSVAVVTKLLSSEIYIERSLMNKFITSCNPLSIAKIFHYALNRCKFQILDAFSSHHLRIAAEYIDLTKVCNEPLIGQYPHVHYLAQLMESCVHVYQDGMLYNQLIGLIASTSTSQSFLHNKTAKSNILYILLDKGASVLCGTHGTNIPPDLLHKVTLLAVQSGMCYFNFFCLYNKISYRKCEFIGTDLLKICHYWNRTYDTAIPRHASYVCTHFKIIV